MKPFNSLTPGVRDLDELFHEDFTFVFSLGSLPDVHCDSPISPQGECTLDLHHSLVINCSEDR